MKRTSFGSLEFKCEVCSNTTEMYYVTKGEIHDILKHLGWVVKVIDDEPMFFCSEECANG